LWKLGKSRGEGGPWKNTSVRAKAPSDPYLMTGFDKKTITLTNNGTVATDFLVEVEIAGSGIWVPYQTFTLAPSATETHVFPEAFGAYWLRVTPSQNTKATAWLVYE